MIIPFTVLQKAGSHMEHTMVASYIVLLLGYMITDCPDHECELTKILPNNSYSTMILVLTKYYKFMNLTGSVSIFIYGPFGKKTIY